MALRMRRAIEVPVRAPDVAAAVAILRGASTGSLFRAGLRVRVGHDGRVRARITGSTRAVPPKLIGRVTSGPRGVVLSGTVRESRSEVLVSLAFGGVGVLMAAVFVALLLVGDWRNPGLYICGVAAVAFAVITGLLRRARRRAFPLEAGELEGAIRAVTG